MLMLIEGVLTQSPTITNLNTSHVNVNQIMSFEDAYKYLIFKYISC